MTLGSSSVASSSSLISPSEIHGGDAPAVDETAPVTTLQIRMANGKKVKARYAY